MTHLFPVKVENAIPSLPPVTIPHWVYVWAVSFLYNEYGQVLQHSLVLTK